MLGRLSSTIKLWQSNPAHTTIPDSYRHPCPPVIPRRYAYLKEKYRNRGTGAGNYSSCSRFLLLRNELWIAAENRLVFLDISVRVSRRLIFIRLSFISLLKSKGRLGIYFALTRRQFLPFFANKLSCVWYLDSFEVARLPSLSGEQCVRSGGAFWDPWIFKKCVFGATIYLWFLLQKIPGIVGETYLFGRVRIDPFLVCNFIFHLIVVGCMVVLLQECVLAK